MREQVGELSVRGPLRKFQQHFAPRTGDALRIGNVVITTLSNASSSSFSESILHARVEHGVQA